MCIGQCCALRVRGSCLRVRPPPAAQDDRLTTLCLCCSALNDGQEKEEEEGKGQEGTRSLARSPRISQRTKRMWRRGCTCVVSVAHSACHCCCCCCCSRRAVWLFQLQQHPGAQLQHRPVGPCVARQGDRAAAQGGGCGACCSCAGRARAHHCGRGAGTGIASELCWCTVGSPLHTSSPLVVVPARSFCHKLLRLASHLSRSLTPVCAWPSRSASSRRRSSGHAISPSASGWRRSKRRLRRTASHG